MPKTEDQQFDDLQAASVLGLFKLVAPALVAYALKKVGDIASYDSAVSKSDALVVLRCVKRWVLHGFKRKPRQK